MINYILLGLTLICTAFNIWLTFKDRDFRSGYDRGLEDGIRLTNEVIEEDNNKNCIDCFGASFGDCDDCGTQFIDCPGR